MQTFVFKAYFIATVLAALLSAESAFAYREPELTFAPRAGGFIDTYGRAFEEYNRRVQSAAKGMTAEQRRRLYDEVFAESKKAFEKETLEAQKQRTLVGKHINRHVKKAIKNEEPVTKDGKAALAKATGEQRSPANQTSPQAPAAPGTGQVDKAVGAEAVKFGGKADLGPGIHSADGGAITFGGAPGAPSAPAGEAAGAMAITFGSAPAAPQKK